jgi:arsenical resistance protein ArsH
MLLVRGRADYLTDRPNERKDVHPELATTLAATALNQETVGRLNLGQMRGGGP